MTERQRKQTHAARKAKARLNHKKKRWLSEAASSNFVRRPFIPDLITGHALSAAAAMSMLTALPNTGGKR